MLQYLYKFWTLLNNLIILYFMGMGREISQGNSICYAYLINRTFFISGFTPKVFTLQTSLPVRGVSIEEDWNF